MEMWIKLMKLLQNSLLLILLLFFTGCCSNRVNNPLTPFPPAPNYKVLVDRPVISFNEKENTYVISLDYLNNAVMNGIFVEEVMIWKRENNIR